MKLIIDIDKDIYNDLRNRGLTGMLTAKECEYMNEAIYNGIPLPKRMISVDLIIKTLCQKDEDYDYPCIAPSYLEEELERLLLDDVPTIVEADKGE